MTDSMKFETYDAGNQIKTITHVNDNGVCFEKIEDWGPILEEAKRERELNEGTRWGEFKKIGIIPMSVYGTFLRQDGGLDVKRAWDWIRKNPALCTFDKALK